jgi:hypothetical protein
LGLEIMRRKANKRKAKPWRRRLRRVFFLIVLVLILRSASVLPEEAFNLRLSPLIAGLRFDWVGWETGAVLEEANQWLRGHPVPGDQETQKSEVRAFLDRQEQIAALEGRIRAETDQLPQAGPAPSLEQSPASPPSIAALNLELEELKRRQQAAAPQVERILAAQVSQVLADHGFGQSGQAWPPVAFRFNKLPTDLIVSPRDEIRIYQSIDLLPDIPDTKRNSLEDAIEARLDVSALVVDLGGIGSWPTMVIDTASLNSVLDIVAHEWTHTYLFFRPLGLHYNDSRDLTTMNETVASIVGSEVAGLVMARYYPELVPPPVTTRKPSPEASNSPYEDFNQAMRRIRLRVDELLAEGRVSESEAYMEAERQKLVAQGYYLRRLNQAYFAFHGSYATSPASVDPIGPWMGELRTQTGSLKAFLDQAAQMRSLGDLLHALGKSEP